MQKTALIVTNHEDLHASSVVSILNGLGCPVFRLNTEWLLKDYVISLVHNNETDSLQISLKNSDFRITDQDIGAIYFRRPSPPEPPEIWGNSKKAIDVVASESRWFLRWMYAYLSDKYWFPAVPSALDQAAVKPLQLKIAKSVGLITPATYLGNNPRTACSFSDGDDVVVKAIRESGFTEDSVFRAFYTATVNLENLSSDHDALGGTINFLQTKVPKKYELRITVVNKKVFPVMIDSQNGPESAIEDWRRTYWKDLNHKLVEIPESLSEKILAYCNKCKLHYGAFDFILTPDDKYVFLECNGNGQWLWLDEIANAGIAEGIAHHLDERCRLSCQ